MAVLYCRARIVSSRPVETFQSGKEKLKTFEELDLLILNGWGDVRQRKIPADWRTRVNPGKQGDRELHPRNKSLDKPLDK